MPGRVDWVLLAYRLPREPSTPRSAVWRKLRRLGAAQVVDGLFAIPRDARTNEQLEWIAGEVVEAGGDATIWLARIGTAQSEREVIERMAETITAEYQAVIADAIAARDGDGATRLRVASRLRRELHRISQRDYFPTPARERARRIVESISRPALVSA
jgi:hypothetical protein